MPAPTTDLVRVEAPDVADDLDRESLVAAIDQDLVAAARLGSATCPAAEVAGALGALRAAASQPGSDLAAVVREHFAFQRSTGRSGGALFTGYYEPVLDGRRQREGAFVHPLYGRPADLIEVALGDFSPAFAGVNLSGRIEKGKLVPYYSRREIDGGHALDGRGLEIAWLDDPVARYFLQVQGSGIVRLADGSTMRVGFAGSNGKAYTSIGRLLVEDGSLGGEPATTPAIQRFLREHPEQQQEILFRNERYIFFREVADGPIGRLGVKLTAGRSIAVDPALYPAGSLAYIETLVPVVDSSGQATGKRPIRRLVLAQDAGAAITGPGRVDLFFGSGEPAGAEAGSMSERGELYLLVPQACADP